MAYDFSGKVEYDDFLKFNRAHLKQYFFSGRKKLLWAVAAALLLLVSASDLYDILRTGRRFTDTTLFFIVILAAVYAILFFVLPKFRYRKLFSSNRFLQETQSFSVTGQLISITSPSTSVQITRDKIEKLVCTPDLICIYISRMQAHLIPRHFFADEAAFTEVSAFIKLHFGPDKGDR